MAVTTLTQQGSVTQGLLDQINTNFAGVTQPDIWVRPQAALNVMDGTYARPYPTMTLAQSSFRPGIKVGLDGVLTEDYSTPKINDVIVMAVGGRPRQATTSGVPNGGGATWLSASASSTASVVQINGQGWVLLNLFLASGAGVTANPTVKIVNAGDPPASNCGEKTSIIGCFITGTDDGIGAVDLPNNCLVDGCTISPAQDQATSVFRRRLDSGPAR